MFWVSPLACMLRGGSSTCWINKNPHEVCSNGNFCGLCEWGSFNKLQQYHTWISSCGSTQKKPLGSPISLSPQKQQEATGTSQEVLWRVSLYEATTSWTQQCNVRWTNTCVLLARNSEGRAKQTNAPASTVGGVVFIYIPSLWVFSHVCYGKTSFHLCLLQQNILSDVCLSKTSLHLCAPAKHRLT